MRDMAISKNGIMRADARDFTLARRAVNRDIFAKSVSIADFRARDAALPFQVLRLQPDACERKNFIFRSKRRVTVNDNVRMQSAFPAERDVFADDTIWPDFTIVSDFGF